MKTAHVGPASRRVKYLRRLAVAAIVVVGASLSIAVWWLLSLGDRELIVTRFNNEAETRIGAVERQFRRDADAVLFVSSFYASSEEVTHDEFRAFTAPMLDRYEDIEGVLWIACVDAEQRSSHEQQCMSWFGPNYGIQEITADGNLVAASERSKYYPVVFLEPDGLEDFSRGLDLGSDPAYRQVLENACDAGEPRIIWQRGTRIGGQRVDGLLIVAPIYRHGAPLANAEQRREALMGFVGTLLRVENVVTEALRYMVPAAIDVEVFFAGSLGRNEFVYGYASQLRRKEYERSVDAASAVSGGLYRADRFPIAGTEWMIVCRATDRFFEMQGSWPPFPLLGLAVGLFATLLIAAYAHNLIGRTEQVERAVEERAAALAKAKAKLEHEIAERKRTEETLRDSEAMYSSLVENLPVRVLRKDLEGRFTFANRSFCELVGRSLEEIVGKTDFDFYPPELARKYRQDDRRVAETGELLECVEENTQDGETRYVQVMKSPVRDARGTVIGVQVVFWDVTEQKQAEAALKHERYLLHALMDHLPHSIYFKDAQSRFTRINRALAQVFGLSDPEEAIGKTDFDFFAEEHAREARADEEEVMRTGRPLIDKEEKEIWPDGRVTWVSTTKLPLYDEQGRVTGTFGVSRDITEKKLADEALRKAKEAAESASRAKSAFLASMSHEIRTPMNVIIGMTELLLGTPVSREQREYLLAVQEASESLLVLINDILDFSKIEAGRLDLESETFDLYETLGDTVRWLGMRAYGKGLELACRIRPGVPLAVVGDCTRLRQVIVNLVSNAIKFTERGEVVVTVQPEEQDDHQVVLHFSVRDTGIGIPEDKLGVIFDAFEQVDSSTRRRHGGTGLGLAISSRLVELMGGRIWVESRPGEGSTFHFTARFDLPADEASFRPPTLPRELAGMRVLIVDDNETNRRILEEILTNWHMRPVSAAGVDEALRLLRQASAQNEPFGLVLSDVHMPERDGFDLAQAIKSDPAIGSIVILMLTSGDRPGDIARCEQLGVAAYLLKPIKQSELYDAIVLAISGESAVQSDVEEATRMPRAVTRPLEILLAEDSLVNQRLAIAVLSKWGHRVTVANNGKEAVARHQERSFDLIIMDVQMPEMDGLDATAAIRAREKRTGQHTPILAMTAHAMKGDRERCIEAGMDDYIAKPIRARELAEKIDALVQSKQGTGSPGGHEVRRDTAADESDESQPRTTPPDQLGGPAMSDFSLDEALRSVRGDRELLRIVCEAVVEDAPRLLGEIERAIEAQDAGALRLYAHALKGSIRYFGNTAAFDTAFQLEKMGREGSLSGASDLFTSLVGEMEQLRAFLVNYLGEEPSTDSA